MTGQEYGVERVAIQVVLEVDPTVFRAADLAADVTDYLVEVLGVCQMAAAGNLEALVVRPMTGAAAQRALREAWGGSLASRGLASDGHPTGLPLDAQDGLS
jgi:hypothetical protein